MQKIAFLIVSFMVGTFLGTREGFGTVLGKQAGIAVQYGKAPSAALDHKINDLRESPQGIGRKLKLPFRHKRGIKSRVEKAGAISWVGNKEGFPLEPLDPRKDFATFIPGTVIGQSVQPLGDVFPLMNFNQQRPLWLDF